jgi:hypothetical protein
MPSSMSEQGPRFHFAEISNHRLVLKKKASKIVNLLLLMLVLGLLLERYPSPNGSSFKDRQ